MSSGLVPRKYLAETNVIHIRHKKSFVKKPAKQRGRRVPKTLNMLVMSPNCRKYRQNNCEQHKPQSTATTKQSLKYSYCYDKNIKLKELSYWFNPSLVC